MQKGAFIVSRDIFTNLIWQDIVKFRIFFYIVGNAVFSKEGVQKGSVKIERGQYLTSYRNLRNDLEYVENNAVKKYSLSTVKRKIDELIEEGRLQKEETQLGTLYTVVNYEEYQCLDNYKKYSLERRKNGERTEKEQQKNNNKNVKNVKNVKNNISNINITNDMSEKNSRKSKYKFNDKQMELAELLLREIRKNNPNHKEPNMKSWANTFRLMMERDQREGREIQEVILWCQQDEFWHTNILSADKLRKQFDRLTMQMKAERKKLNKMSGGESFETLQSSYPTDYSKYDFFKKRTM